ncbi:MAG TPA: GntR family transcriptional regulator [Vicinamibacterales bacterium]|nr:GntR family transcriptional regulator [Vicinamibacterales bacterium]
MTNVTSSLAHEAYRVVRQRIMRGELSLGQVISRRKLATELGMSFLPVSEALQRLEVEGLLESRPRAGTRVRIPTRDEVRGHFVVREALEVQAAMLFAKEAKPSERRELHKLAARVDTLAAQPTRTLVYAMLHHKLHRRIAECARCPALTDAIERTHALASIWLGLLRHPSPSDATSRHQDLLDALASGDGDRAAAAMREHVTVGLNRTLEVLEPYFRMRPAHRQTFVRSERKQQLQGIVPPRRRAPKVRYQTV